MFLGIDWEPVMPAITAVLVFGTVVLGIAGLYSDSHTKDGKLTRSGWRVAGFMVVLGILTFLSGLANQRIADAKERALAKERTKQFQAQIGALRRLQGDMQGSLRSQRELYSVADRSLGISTTLQRQTRANTDAVLRRVFSETNRVALERIILAFTSECPLIDRYTDPPKIDGAMITFSPSTPQAGIFAFQPTDEIFRNFWGALGPYESFEAWRGVRIMITLHAKPPMGQIIPLDDFTRLSPEERSRIGRVPDDYKCPVSVTLIVNGRDVLMAKGRLERVSANYWSADFIDLRADPAKLPRFTR